MGDSTEPPDQWAWLAGAIAHIRQRDHQLAESGQFNRSYRPLLQSIKCRYLDKPTIAFARNMERIQAAWNLPWGVSFQTWVKAVGAADGGMSWMAVKADLMRYLADADPEGIGEGIAALHAGMLISMWTAFETLACDVWIAAVNNHPTGLARLSGAPGRIEKKTGGSAGESYTDAAGDEETEVETPGKTISLNEIDRFTGGTFDIRTCLGDLLRGQFKLTTLAGIREAYSRAFSQKESQARTHAIDTALADKTLDALCIVRNLLVHTAGVADRRYLKDWKTAQTAPKLELDQLLELDGKQVRDLMDPVIIRCVELVRAVDSWLVQTGGQHAESDTPAA